MKIRIKHLGNFNGKKVPAIKAVRELSGLGLKPAKGLIDAVTDGEIKEFAVLPDISFTHAQVSNLEGEGFTVTEIHDIDSYMDLAEPLLERLKAERRMTALCLVTDALKAVKQGMV